MANWSGQFPGLVGLLNLTASLTKAKIEHSILWSRDFTGGCGLFSFVLKGSDAAARARFIDALELSVAVTV